MLLHDAGVILRVGSGRNRVDQSSECLDTAHAVKRTVAAEALGHSDSIYRFVRVEELPHDLEDPLVGWLVEVLGMELLECHVGCIARKKNRPEYRLLSIDAVWRHPGGADGL